MALALMGAVYFWTRAPHIVLFWIAFILTRPLGATVGDFSDKPIAQGGLDVSRPFASAILAVAIALLVAVLPQRAAAHPHDAAPMESRH